MTFAEPDAKEECSSDTAVTPVKPIASPPLSAEVLTVPRRLQASH